MKEMKQSSSNMFDENVDVENLNGIHSNKIPKSKKPKQSSPSKGSSETHKFKSPKGTGIQNEQPVSEDIHDRVQHDSASGPSETKIEKGQSSTLIENEQKQLKWLEGKVMEMQKQFEEEKNRCDVIKEEHQKEVGFFFIFNLKNTKKRWVFTVFLIWEKP